jgi:hypothetical protein
LNRRAGPEQEQEQEEEEEEEEGTDAAGRLHSDFSTPGRERSESYRNTGAGYQRVVSNPTAIGSSPLFTSIGNLAHWARNFDSPLGGGPVMAW